MISSHACIKQEVQLKMITKCGICVLPQTQSKNLSHQHVYIWARHAYYLHIQIDVLTFISHKELSVALQSLRSVSSGRYGSVSRLHGMSLCISTRQVSCLINRFITSSIIRRVPPGGAVSAILESFLTNAATVYVGNNLKKNECNVVYRKLSWGDILKPHIHKS